MTTEIGDDDPIPLARAAQLFFHGHLTKSSVRTDAAKGNLEIIQIANKDFVIRNGIKRMIEKCRKSEDRPGSGLDQTPAPGSSRTEPGVSPWIALKQMLEQRKRDSQNTSPPSTDRNAAVVQLR